MLRASTPWGVLHRSSEHRAVGSSGTACAALLEIDTRGTLLRGLRKSTDAAARHRAPGVGALQRAPRAWGGLMRVHLHVALFSCLVGDVDRGGAQAPAAPPQRVDLPSNRRLSAAV